MLVEIHAPDDPLAVEDHVRHSDPLLELPECVLDRRALTGERRRLRLRHALPRRKKLAVAEVQLKQRSSIVNGHHARRGHALNHPIRVLWSKFAPDTTMPSEPRRRRSSKRSSVADEDYAAS